MRSVSAIVHGPNHKWWALSAVAVGILMSTLDSGSVSVTMPTIMAQFQVDVATIQWIVLAFLLTITVTLLPFGRLADIRGRKQVYAGGLLIFVVGSALSGISNGVEQLIVFRIIQALGASMLMANGMAITSAVFPPAQRGMALGINGTVVATGITLGPALGGVLTEWLGWRSVFFVNLPLGIVGVVLTLVVLNDHLITPGFGSGRRPAFDWLGAMVAGAGLLALTMALAGGSRIGLSDVATVALYATAVLALVAFILIELRISEPMIDLGLFRLQLFALGSAAGLLSFLAVSANMFLLPFYLQLILGFPPSQAGLLMIPTSLVIAAISPFSGWLSDHLGARLLSTTGLAIVCISLLSLSRLNATSGYSDVLLMLVILGLGQGLFQSPNNSSVIGSVPRERYGVAGGFLSMMRNLGMVTGAALASNLLMGGLADTAGHVNLSVLTQAGAADSDLILAGFVSGMERAYLVAAIIAAFGILASLSRGGAFGRTSAPHTAKVGQPVIDSAGRSEGLQADRKVMADTGGKRHPGDG